MISAFCKTSEAAAPELKILNLSDKQTTIRDRLILTGQAIGATKVIVNGEEVDLKDDGRFKVGLVVNVGKNLVVAVAKRGSEEKKLSMRLLRLVTFLDISGPGEKPHWAKKDIIDLAALGVIEGYPEGRFKPGNPVLRGEMATWLVRAKGYAVKTLDRDPFLDVPKEHWRAPFIDEAVKRGYMTGYPNGFFGIDDLLTRASAATVVRRSEELSATPPDEKIFVDVSTSVRSYDDINRAYKAGLFIGVSKTRKVFEPTRPMTRGEAAKLLSRFSEIKAASADLLNFDAGYGEERLCRVNTEPEIVSAAADPVRAPRDGKTPATFFVTVSDRQGLSDISQVRVDLRAIGGPPDALMFNNGENGDEKAGDATYSLSVVIGGETDLGVKRLLITVMDRSGWEAKGSLNFSVVKP
jgi:hypothetical protein